MDFARQHAFGDDIFNHSLHHAPHGSRTETRIYRCPDPACHGGYHLTSIVAWQEKKA